jgi:hypothetical protein
VKEGKRERKMKKRGREKDGKKEVFHIGFCSHS